MSDEFHMTISIPADDEGYILLQCEHCGTFFKATPSDIEDDGVLHLFCPSCGLSSENYVTEDVMELATKMAQNKFNDMIYDMFKNLERHNRRNSMLNLRQESVPSMKQRNQFVLASKHWRLHLFLAVDVLPKSNHY